VEVEVEGGMVGVVVGRGVVVVVGSVDVVVVDLPVEDVVSEVVIGMLPKLVVGKDKDPEMVPPEMVLSGGEVESEDPGSRHPGALALEGSRKHSNPVGQQKFSPGQRA